MRWMNSWVSVVVAVVIVAGLALSAGADVEIGAKAPAFSLTDQNGKAVSLSDYQGKIVVLEWFNPNCPFVKRHYAADRQTMIRLAATYQPKNVVWLAINSTKSATVDQNKTASDNWKLQYPVLDDSKGEVAKAYGAKTTPHMFIIDATGKLVYQGAIDDDKDGDKGTGATNYVSKALDEILAGKPVSTPQTKSYGCGVKY